MKTYRGTSTPILDTGSFTLAGRHDTRKLLLQVLVNSQGDL